MKKLIYSLLRIFGVPAVLAVSLYGCAVTPEEFMDDAVKNCPVCQAVISGHAERVQYFLSAGEDPNKMYSGGDSISTPKYTGGMNLLGMAAYADKPNTAQVLLDNGANPDADAVHKSGWTALMIASEHGHAEVAKVLLDAGANPKATDNIGITALMIAAANNSYEVAKMLLAAGVNVNAASKKSGGTALLGTTIDGHAEVARILLAAGANPNAAFNDGETALMVATNQGHHEVAKLLLAAGANPDLKNKSGKTAWDYIKGDKRMEYVFEKALEEWHKKLQ